MKKSLLEIVNIVLSEKQVQLEVLNSDTDLRLDLGMDSMELALLTVLIEDEYGVDIFQDGLISNVSDILKKINV
jgi:acyl carrier protein